MDQTAQTALTRYQRLEATGLWRTDPREQRREVVVSFGHATLVMTDPRNGAVLSHWSLPAVTRQNAGRMPALYSPDGDDKETLEIDEPLMVEALEEIRSALVRSRGRTGRLRLGVGLMMLAGLIFLGNFWLPGAVVGHAASVLPMAKRAAIGQEMLDDLTASGVRVCSVASGRASLSRLVDRVLGPNPVFRAEVVDARALAPVAAPGPLVLPGRVIVIDHRLIEGRDTPDVAVGYLLAASLVALRHDPVLPALEAAGTLATLRLLTLGTLPSDALDGYGIHALRRAFELPDTEALLAGFARLNVSSRGFAYAVDPSGETTLALIEADPLGMQPPALPILPDADWIRIQGICDE
jgi:hypothetical protein